MKENENQRSAQVTRGWYHASLEGAQNEIADIERRLIAIDEEKRRLQERYAEIMAVAQKLQALCTEDEEKEIVTWAETAKSGIQECCYRVLLEAEGPLDAASIRNRLETVDIDMGRYANPLAVIHTSLKRIPDRVRSGKGQTEDANGRTVSVRLYEAIRETGAEAIPAPKK